MRANVGTCNYNIKRLKASIAAKKLAGAKEEKKDLPEQLAY